MTVRVKTSLVLLVASLISQPANAALGADDDLIVPGERIGMLTATTTEAELKAALKPGEYKRVLVALGEGYCRPGSLLYPGTDKELQVTWKSNNDDVECAQTASLAATLERADAFTRPDYVRIDTSGARWHTQEGLRIGLDITAVQKINGKPFVFSGFGWDYGGRVISWENGAITKGLTVALNYGELTPAQEKLIPIGEVDVRSDKQGLPQDIIKIESIFMDFPDAGKK